MECPAVAPKKHEQGCKQMGWRAVREEGEVGCGGIQSSKR